MMSTRLGNGFSLSGGRMRVAIKRAVLVLAGALLAVPSFGSVAHAKEYTLPEASIVARVTPDGALKITERLTYTFTGPFSGAYRSIPLEEGQAIRRVQVRDEHGRLYQPGAPT